MEGWITFDEETLYLYEVSRRWGVSSYALVDIIIKSIDIDGICRLRPYLKKYAPKAPRYKALPVDIDSLRVNLLVNKVQGEAGEIVFRLPGTSQNDLGCA